MNPLTHGDMYAVGLMSGTSADGIDAVLLHTDGITPPQMLASHVTPYSTEIRQQIVSLYKPSVGELDRMGMLDHRLGEIFAQAALAVIQKAGLTPQHVQVIGSHGQTVRHRPPQWSQSLSVEERSIHLSSLAWPEGWPSFTLQIGSPFVIAALTGITTVANFRPADMVRQGEGAPLVPLFHHALFAAPHTTGRSGERVAVVNLGGIANVTALPADPQLPLLAGDTGPANTLLDLYAEWTSQGIDSCDRDGQLASQGQVDDVALQWLLDEPYFKRPLPKSTGRELFGSAFLQRFLHRFPHIDRVDCFATLSELTVRTIADACRQILAPAPHRLILCGGGAKNKEIFKRLQKQLPDSEIIDSAVLGVDADTLEAQAFAWFAVRTLRHLPSSLPGATGANAAAVLGAIHPGSAFKMVKTSPAHPFLEG